MPGPFDAWLVLRGLKTLAVRMRQHCENARQIAEFLDRPRGGRDRPLPRLARPSRPRDRTRQMRDFGGMISFLVESEEEAVALVARTKIWKLAESLGGVESLIEQPVADDARIDRGRAVRRPAEPRPPVGRHRVGRRPDRGPRRRARAGACGRARRNPASLRGVTAHETNLHHSHRACSPARGSCRPRSRRGRPRRGSPAGDRQDDRRRRRRRVRHAVRFRGARGRARVLPGRVRPAAGPDASRPAPRRARPEVRRGVPRAHRRRVRRRHHPGRLPVRRRRAGRLHAPGTSRSSAHRSPAGGSGLPTRSSRSSWATACRRPRRAATAAPTSSAAGAFTAILLAGALSSSR